MPTRPKLAVVTGASRGLGQAIAEALSERGFHLVLTARDQPSLNRLAARLPNATAVACDIRDPQSVAGRSPPGARELAPNHLKTLAR